MSLTIYRCIDIISLVIKMLIDYLKKNKISIYSLSKKSGVAYTTVNDLANGRVDVENCKAGILKKLSWVLSIGMDELYDVCRDEKVFYSQRRKTEVRVKVSDKKYYADFFYNGNLLTIPVAPVNEGTSYYIDELSVWKVEEAIDEYVLKEF